jgi:hypothetical protein
MTTAATSLPMASSPVTLWMSFPQGASTLTEIQLSESIDPGSIQWTGKQLLIAKVVGTHGDNPIYKVRVSGLAGTVRGPILLSSSNGRSAAGDIQFWLQKKTMIGPGHSEGGNGFLQFWNYPRSGLPTKVIKHKKHGAFFGVTVSIAPSH